MRESAWLWGWVVACVLSALLFSGIVARGPAPGPIKSNPEAQSGQSKQSASEPRPLASKTQDQPPSAEDEAYCARSQSPPDCLIQLRTARTTERQAETAQGALWVGFATLVAAVVATVGAWLAAVAARRTGGTMENTAQRELRAYVGAGSAVIRNVRGSPWEMQIELQNSGHSPAKEVHACTSHHIFHKEIKDDDWIDATETSHNFGIIDPRQCGLMVIRYERPSNENIDAMRRTGENRTLHIKTVAIYRDIFGTKYERTFSHYVNGYFMEDGVNEWTLFVSPRINEERVIEGGE